MAVNSPVGIYNICECLFMLSCGVHKRCGVNSYGWHVDALIGSFDTSLLLFLKCHVDKHVYSDWMVYTFERFR